MPNALSPNDDDVNDGISPKLDYSTVLEEFSVFNRWGDKVFTTAQKQANPHCATLLIKIRFLLRNRAFYVLIGTMFF
jgi:hypothetical protein